MIKDINPGRGWSNLSGITTVNRIIYFTADDGTHGAALWRSDGTARGTRMVKDINPYELTDVNGTLHFATLSDASHVSELWRSDGTEAGTTVVKKRERLGPHRLPRRPLLAVSAVQEGCGEAMAPRQGPPWSRP